MTLGELIAALEAADPHKTVPKGFGRGDSYRGFYDELAFEPCNDVTVGMMLYYARESLFTMYEGYKGGNYIMTPDTPVWLANWGCTGEPITTNLIKYMLKD